MIGIVDATTDAEYRSAKALIEEYARALGVDLCFQGLDEELRSLAAIYAAPHGCLLLAKAGDAFVGLVALRAHADATCELKRLYVQERYRGAGTGRALAQAAIARARALGYTCVVLDTLETMAAARKLYASLGFAAADAYYVNPLAGVQTMKLDLATSSGADK